jgi:hypothetical protein
MNQVISLEANKPESGIQPVDTGYPVQQPVPRRKAAWGSPSTDRTATERHPATEEAYE